MEKQIKEQKRYESDKRVLGIESAKYQNINSNFYTSYRFFVQPGYGVIRKKIAISVAGKFSGIFTDFNKTRYTHFTFEPAIVAKFGRKTIKSIFQIGYMFPLLSEFTEPIDAQRLILSVGLQINLGYKK